MKTILQELYQQIKALLNGNPSPSPAPALAPTPKANFVMPENIRLEVSKAIHTLSLTNAAYNLGIWSSPEAKAQWVNDIGVFLAFNNLSSVVLELIGADKTVVASVGVNFGQHADGHSSGPPSGTEVPVLDKKLVASHRVIVHWKRTIDEVCRPLLKLQWATVKTLKRRNGDQFANSQARKTGGRQTGAIFASKDNRQTLVVTRPIGTKGFGFADCPALKLTGVFVHSRHLRGVPDLRLGQRVTALLIQIPTGIQAREVRAA
jgi:cold shock CspA family protein